MNAPLTRDQRKSLVRALGVGVSLAEVAGEYGITVAGAQAIERVELRRNRVRQRVAEPLPALRDLNWRTARPAAELYLPSEGCFWPIGDPRDGDYRQCGASRVHQKPYCAEHCSVGFSRFKAVAA